MPLTLHDGAHSYELVEGPGWHQVIAIDLPTGKARWKLELGKEPITHVAIANGALEITQGREYPADRRGHRSLVDVILRAARRL